MLGEAKFAWLIINAAGHRRSTPAAKDDSRSTAKRSLPEARGHRRPECRPMPELSVLFVDQQPVKMGPAVNRKKVCKGKSHDHEQRLDRSRAIGSYAATCALLLRGGIG